MARIGTQFSMMFVLAGPSESKLHWTSDVGEFPIAPFDYWKVYTSYSDIGMTISLHHIASHFAHGAREREREIL